MKIIDPKENIIFSIKEKIHIFYDFIANITGKYIYIIDNKMNDFPLKLTFAIHQGSSTDELLNKEHINSTYSILQNIRKKTKNARFAARLLTKKYDAHYEYVEKHNRNFFLYAMIETFTLILIFFFQLCYIKNLIKNNRANIC